jgi:hypothetical protein
LLSSGGDQNAEHGRSRQVRVSTLKLACGGFNATGQGNYS